MPNTICPAGIKLIQAYEQCRLKAYRVPGDEWTIGWGHTGRTGDPDVTDGMTITQEQADAMFQADLQKFAANVAKRIKVPVSDNQFSAIVSLAYNIGVNGFPTLLRRLNNKDYHGAAAAFMLYVNFNGQKCEGLVKRRTAEAALFNDEDIANHIYVAAAEASDAFKNNVVYAPKTIDPPQPPKSIFASKTAATAVVVASSLGGSNATDIINAGQTVFNNVMTLSSQAQAVGTSLGVQNNFNSITIGVVVLGVLGCVYIIYDRYIKLHHDLV